MDNHSLWFCKANDNMTSTVNQYMFLFCKVNEQNDISS